MSAIPKSPAELQEFFAESRPTPEWEFATPEWEWCSCPLPNDPWPRRCYLRYFAPGESPDDEYCCCLCHEVAAEAAAEREGR